MCTYTEADCLPSLFWGAASLRAFQSAPEPHREPVRLVLDEAGRSQVGRLPGRAWDSETDHRHKSGHLLLPGMQSCVETRCGDTRIGVC